MTLPRSDGWECGDCSLPEEITGTIDHVCHHCGKLLCDEHKRELPDDAFSGPAVSRTRLAVHCDDCIEAHHRVAAPRPKRR